MAAEALAGSSDASGVEVLTDFAVFGEDAGGQFGLKVSCVGESEAEGREQAAHDGGEEFVPGSFHDDGVEANIGFSEGLWVASGFFHGLKLGAECLSKRKCTVGDQCVDAGAFNDEAQIEEFQKSAAVATQGGVEVDGCSERRPSGVRRDVAPASSPTRDQSPGFQLLERFSHCRATRAVGCSESLFTRQFFSSPRLA